MRPIVIFRVFLVGLVTVVVSARAQEPVRGLEERKEDSVWVRLAAQEQAQGEFEQTLFDEEGELVERSRGRYAILRPGYFRWEIDEPDRQQITVADGTLWHYDLDLATATSRAVDEDENFTALDLLARDGDELAERFRVELLGAGHYRLYPLFPQAGFSMVELLWDDESLRAMTVERRGGQSLSLDFKPTVLPEALGPADFEFVVPPGVDVQRAGGY